MSKGLVPEGVGGPPHHVSAAPGSTLLIPTNFLSHEETFWLITKRSSLPDRQMAGECEKPIYLTNTTRGTSPGGTLPRGTPAARSHAGRQAAAAPGGGRGHRWPRPRPAPPAARRRRGRRRAGGPTSGSCRRPSNFARAAKRPEEEPSPPPGGGGRRRAGLPARTLQVRGKKAAARHGAGGRHRRRLCSSARLRQPSLAPAGEPPPLQPGRLSLPAARRDRSGTGGAAWHPPNPARRSRARDAPPRRRWRRRLPPPPG